MVASNPVETMDVTENGSDVFTVNEWQSLAEELHLSGRELQIVRHIFDDEKESMIARHLGMSPHTVHTHIGRLYRKLDTGSRCGLILRVFRRHLDRAVRHRIVSE